MPIEKWVFGGDGLGRIDGRVVFVPFVLPGETARIEVTPRKTDLLRGEVREIVAAAPERVAAPCPYFGRCGGCQYQHAPYSFQAAQKREIVREVVRRVGKFDPPDEIGLETGPEWNYRNRTQLHFAEGELGYMEAASHRLCAITHCPISSPALNAAIATLREMLRDRRFPRFLRSLELFTNESETQFNVLEADQPVARSFFQWAAEGIPGAGLPALDYAAAGERFRVGYKSFFQVNRFLLDRLSEVALEGAEGASALDLYAGVGLFTLPLARRFAAVTAVESGQSAVADLEYNAARAGVAVAAVRGDVQQALAQIQDRPDFVLADPPRTGLGKWVVKELLRLKPERLTIVACDPATLARDLAALREGGYGIARMTVVDLFPQTAHIETVVQLRLG